MPHTTNQDLIGQLEGKRFIIHTGEHGGLHCPLCGQLASPEDFGNEIGCPHLLGSCLDADGLDGSNPSDFEAWDEDDGDEGEALAGEETVAADELDELDELEEGEEDDEAPELDGDWVRVTIECDDGFQVFCGDFALPVSELTEPGKTAGQILLDRCQAMSAALASRPVERPLDPAEATLDEEGEG